MIPTISEIVSESKIHPSRVKNIYTFGSRVYGTFSENSDWDFIMIANTPNSTVEIKSGMFNIHVMTQEQFLNSLKNHHSGCIECILSPDKFRIKEDLNFDFKFNLPSLRHSFSHISSNSWIKAKKKIEQNDYHTGIKSAFHSLRIPLFGIQIVKYGKIIDFTESNFVYERLMSKRNWTFDEIDYEFRTLRDKILSDFRNLTYN